MNVFKLLLGSLLCLAATTFSMAQPGTLDPNFDSDGFLTFDAGTFSDSGEDILVLDNGKILVVGSSVNGLVGDVFVVRYNPDGSLDNTFGNGGRDSIDIDFVKQVGYCIAVQPDGKIVVGGSSGQTFADQDFMVMRLNPDGGLDNSFNGTGYHIIEDSNTDVDRVYDVQIAPDGSIFAIGEMDGGNALTDIAVAKFTPGGALDNSFSFDGVVTTDFNSTEDVAEAGIIQTDGKIVVAGVTEDVNGPNFSQFALVRYNTDGTLDNTFGNNGRLEYAFSPSADFATTLNLMPDGRLLVGGNSPVIQNLDFALLMLNSDGSVDSTFSGNGKVNVNIDGDDFLYGVDFQSDGKILLSGFSLGANQVITAVRLNADGTPDNTFGTAGEVAHQISGFDMTINASALQQDGKLVLVGTAEDVNNNREDFGVARIITEAPASVGIGKAPDVVLNLNIFPNPITNSSITFEYELKENQQLIATLFNLAGKEISTLLQTERPAGFHRETLTVPAGLASGQYLLQLQTPKGTTAVQVQVH